MKKIILTGHLGLDGMKVIMEKKETDLKKRYAPAFLGEAKRQISREPEYTKEQVEALTQAAVFPLGEGGIFTGLWNLAAELETGIVTDLKKFSLLQETIEICERYRINPYQLRSRGCYLVVTDDETAVRNRLEERGIPCAVIGELINNNDKIIQNGEDIRYIDRPGPDELEKIL